MNEKSQIKQNEFAEYEKLKEKNKELEKLVKAAELERENNAKFWSKISHEMRNSLNGIIGMSNLWKTEIYDIDNVKDGFEKIQDCSKALLGISNGIIDYTTIGNQSVSLNEKEFDFKEMITGISILIHEKAVELGKEFNIFIQDVLNEKLIGDEFRIRQILSCFLNGGIRLAPENGKLNLKISQLKSSGKTAYMRFVFNVSGENLDKEKVIRYITHFTSDTNNFQWGYDGNDIDLYVCTYFIQMMNGNIMTVEKNDNEYEMIFDLELKSVLETENIENHAYYDKKILLVADDAEICESRGKMLAQMGISYEYATDIDQTLDKIGEADNGRKPYGACIVDWNAKRFSVSELVTEIRNIFGRELIIVANVYDVARWKREARKLGVTYLIEQTWFCSTIYDMLLNIQNGNIEKQTEEIFNEHQYDFSGRNVLIIEDMKVNQEVVEKLLSKVGVTVYAACDGKEGLQQFLNGEEGFFDCIFMDINMPVMNGYEATEAIRNSGKIDAKTVPIYAMTANAFAEDIVDAIDAGMNGYITKPVEFDSLLKTLEKAFAELDEKKDKDAKFMERVAEFEAKNAKLKKQNQELRIKVERDPLTKLLNRYGFEKKVSKLVQADTAVGFVLVDLDNFKTINDTYGHDMGDKALVKLANILQNKFRTSDDVIRFGGDEFVVLLKNFSQDKYFVIRKINEINEETSHSTDDVPSFSISAGASFSECGYREELYKLADKALYQVKNNGRKGCMISEDNIVIKNDEDNEKKWNKSWYEEEVYYANGDNGELLEERQSYVDVLLSSSSAVGYISGFYRDGLPIYSISEFALHNLGYTYEEFQEKTNGLFETVVYHDDLEMMLHSSNDKEFESQNIRLIGKNGNVIWFAKKQISAYTVNGEEVWIAAFRNIDEAVVGELCNKDYQVISLIYCRQDMIVFEKGEGSINGYHLEKRKKYNYSSLIEIISQNNIKQEEREEFLHNAEITNIKQKLELQGLYEFVSYHLKKDGSYGAIRFKMRYVDKEKEIILCTQESVERWAESDDLTGILNEQGFHRNVSRMIKNDDLKREYTILYFDVVGFKAWNEMLGYSGANILLKRIADRLEKSKMKPYLVSRFMADHFVCLIDKKRLDYDEISDLCSFKEEIEANNVNIRMQCGIYSITDRYLDVRGMCDRAKIAKTHITNEFAIPYAEFSSGMDEQYLNELFIINSLDRALNNKEFKVFYQPIFDTKTKKVVSAEALVRWILPGKKVISPGAFIPIFEKKGYIAELDYFVENSVQTFLEERVKENKECVPISMNLSRMDFINEKYINLLKENVFSTVLAHKYLRFEVTESAYVDVGDQGSDLISEFRKNELKILIDDFGTGYSSLENLLNIECDIIKIDMKFVKNIGKNYVAEEIIRSIVETCHKTNRLVIAEGVETQQQYEFMLEVDCDYIQGFYFSKPLSQEEFSELLESKK